MHNFTSLFVSILNVSFMAVVVFILILLTKLLLKNQLSPRLDTSHSPSCIALVARKLL